MTSVSQQPSVKPREPRLLTDAEIDDIVNYVMIEFDLNHGGAVGLTLSTVKTARDGLERFIRGQIKGIKLTPDGIPEMKDWLRKEFRGAFVPPGDTVGQRATDPIGQALTQANLNAFHTAGVSHKSASGMRAVSEVLLASKNRMYPTCDIHLKRRFDLFETFDLKKEFEEITLDSLLDIQSGFEVAASSKYDIMETATGEEPDWYKIYRLLRMKPLVKSSYFMRLHINRYMLYKYRLPMKTVVDKIEEHFSQNGVTCIPTPQNRPECFIDVFVKEETISTDAADTTFRPNESLFFFENTMSTQFTEIKFGGITGIKSVIPIGVKPTEIVTEETPTEDGYELVISKNLSKIKGVGLRELRQLLQACKIGHTVLPSGNVRVTKSQLMDAVRLTELEMVTAPTSVVQVVNAVIAKDEEIEKKHNANLRENGIRQRNDNRYRSEVYLAKEYFYLQSEGGTMKQLLTHPMVDKQKSYSNNVHEIRQLLGIGAARRFLEMDMKRLFDQIDFRHIELLTNTMITRGVVLALTYGGIQKQPKGPYSKATHQQATQIFAKAAASGELEKMNSVSTCILVGKRVPVGTGLPKLRIQDLRLTHGAITEDLVNNIGNLEDAPFEAYRTYVAPKGAMELVPKEMLVPSQVQQVEEITRPAAMPRPVAPAVVAAPVAVSKVGAGIPESTVPAGYVDVVQFASLMQSLLKI